jgi:rhomboid family GlyGly-CTERM serine protease
MTIGALLEYDRAAILHGEVWRLITGHFVHWSFAHLAWDLLAFVTLGAICARRRWLFVAVVIATALVVSLFLLICCPEVAMYRGLSAIVSALWLWAVFIIGERRVSLALTLLSLFVAKLMIESTGVALFVDGITLLPVVHLVGAAIGFCGAVAEHKMTSRTDAALYRTGRRDRVRRRRDESAVVGGVA